MSYDLAVWEGERPIDDATAGEVYEALFDLAEEDEQPPTPRIRGYVQALVERWSDGVDGPWSVGPLIDQASGPFIYFCMVYSKAEEVSAHAADLAREHGLVCYDPQLEQLRPVSLAHDQSR